ncbi:MAG: cobalt ECF transporter T component CbiQ [Methanotrichaceae archaeon]|nr:cobalt ECF transporter T component CbiQ [Methanotrichaceae archaeon]
MQNLLDDYAQSNALRDTSPRLKLLLGIGAMLLCVSSVTPIAPLFVAITMSFIIVILAKIPTRFYCTLLLIPLSFALLSALVVAFMHGTGNLLFSFEVLGFNLSISEDGANLALLLIARTFGGMCCLFFIALTTPMIEIFSVLRSLKVPEVLIELSMMIYRYIFVFLDQAIMIHNAQAMRLGNSGFKTSLNSYKMLSGVLFVRAWEQGERLMVAMVSRCYNGKFYLMEQTSKTSMLAIFGVVGYIAAVASIVVLTRDFRLL